MRSWPWSHRPARTASRASPRSRGRRGAALVLTTILFTGLVGMLAISVDMSRLFLMGNELQTAADAAALAGARTLIDAPEQARASAVAVGEANAGGTSVARVQEVIFGRWDEQNRQFSAVAAPEDADAVRVWMGGQTRHLIARLLGYDEVQMRRVATAFPYAQAAPVARCAKPWAIAYSDLMETLGKGPDDALTGEDVRRMRDTASEKLQVTLHQRDKLEKGAYGAVVLPPVNSPEPGKRGGAAYRDNIMNCNTLRVGDIVESEPGGKKGPTEQGMQQFCQPLSGGICYNARGGIGVPATVAVWKPLSLTETGGRQHARVEFIATIVITEYRPDASVRAFFFTLNEQGPAIPGSEERKSTFIRNVLVQ